jgi:PKD repeat protein
VQIFPKPGYYSAQLTVSNDQTGCVKSQKETILVGSSNPGEKADFIYLTNENNTVQFTDRSIGDGLSYFWDFNDGQTSTEPNPEHTYTKPGYYYVCLTVVSPEGKQNTYCERIFAGTDIQDECLAQFGYTVWDDLLRIACQDRSFGNPDAWKWTYNDGWATTAQNPVYNIGRAGYHKVQLSISNSLNGCRDDAYGLINVASEPRLKAGFGYDIDSSNLKAESYPVDFVGVSLGDAGKLKWSFGDGTYDSTSINPTHVYDSPGTYEVCLTITNTSTGEEDTQCETINVGGPTFVRGLTEENNSLKAYPNPVSEICKVEINLKESTNANLTLYDLMGRRIKVIFDKELPAGEYSFELDASAMKAGNYYLILRTEKGIARHVLSIR